MNLSLLDVCKIAYSHLPVSQQPSILKSHVEDTAGHGISNDDAQKAVLHVDFTDPKNQPKIQ